MNSFIDVFGIGGEGFHVENIFCALSMLGATCIFVALFVAHEHFEKRTLRSTSTLMLALGTLGMIICFSWWPVGWLGVFLFIHIPIFIFGNFNQLVFCAGMNMIASLLLTFLPCLLHLRKSK